MHPGNASVLHNYWRASEIIHVEEDKEQHYSMNYKAKAAKLDLTPFLELREEKHFAKLNRSQKLRI